MIKQLLNSVIAKYRDLSVSRRSIICLSLRLRQIIDLLATDKSRYFAQPRPIIANCLQKEAQTISVYLIYLFRRKYFFAVCCAKSQGSRKQPAGDNWCQFLQQSYFSHTPVSISRLRCLISRSQKLKFYEAHAK